MFQCEKTEMEDNIFKMNEYIKDYRTKVDNHQSMLSTKEYKLNELSREKDVLHKQELELHAVIENLKKEKRQGSKRN